MTLYQCLVAVVTNHYKFSGLKRHRLLSYSSGGQSSAWASLAKIKVEAGLRSFPEAPEETLPAPWHMTRPPSHQQWLVESVSCHSDTRSASLLPHDLVMTLGPFGISLEISCQAA